MKCPHCQKQNRPGLLLYEHCGHQLLTLSDFSRYQTRSIATEPAALAPLDFQRPGTGYLHRSSVVTLDLLDANKKVCLKTTGHIVLGRADKDAQWQPTVDLTPYGPSRRAYRVFTPTCILKAIRFLCSNWAAPTARA
jgi:hypothetical protein